MAEFKSAMMELGLGAGVEDIGSPPGMMKVSVAVRVRPLIEREKSAEAQIHWQVGSQELTPYDPVLRRIAPHAQTYTYDHVFHQSTQTQQVYDTMVSPIVKKAFKGFNGTILCYGQTSSGKTHTLYGSNDDKGIILLFADHLYQHIKADESHRQYIIKVGLLEIYNEKVSDLLNSYNPIELQERDGSIVPHGLEELTVFDINDWKKVTERVQRERKIGETRMNKESSRSHTILRVTIESFDLTTNTAFDDVDEENPENSPPLTTAVLHFVDLAGSEKQSQTGAEGERFKEQVNINMSLSVLSRVIKQLSEQASVTESHQGKSSTTEPSLAKAMCQSLIRNPPKSRFINFRDSKLTRLLQSSLNGEAFISMVCNVTIASFEETKSTLQFAKQAKKIQIRPKQNLCSTKSEYDNKLHELQELLNSKDKEVLVLRRQCENMKRAFEFRDEQTTQRAPTIDRRLSLCPTMFRSSASKSRHSNPEPMSTFSYYKNKYSSSSKVDSLGLEDDFMSSEEFVKTLRKPLKPIKESKCSDVIRFDKEVQTESCDEEGSRLPPLSTIRESLYEDSPVVQLNKTAESELPRTPDLQLSRNCDPLGTPAPMLRLNNALLRSANEDDRLEYEEMKTYLESEVATLREDVASIPKLKLEIEKLQFEKKELENDVMRQVQASRVEMTRLLTESPEMLTLKSRLQAAEETVVNKDKKIETMTVELHNVNKMHQEKGDEVEQQLKELQNTVKKLASENQDLKSKHRSQVEICEEQVKQLEEQRSLISSVTKQADEHEHCQNLASKLKLAEDQVDKLVANEALLQEQVKTQQDAFEKAETRAHTEVSELQNRLQVAEEQVLEKVKLIEKVTTEFQTQQERYKELEPKLKELQSAVVKLISTNEDLEQKLKTQAEVSEEQRSIIASLGEQAEEHYERCQELTAKLKLAEDQIDMMVANEATLQQQLKVQEVEYQKAESALQEMKLELLKVEDTKIADLKNKIQAAEEQAAQKDELVQNVTAELQSAKAQLENFEDLESQLLDLETINMKLLSTNEDLELKLENQVKVSEEQQRMITAVFKEVEEHKNCQDLTIKLKAAEDQLETLLAAKVDFDAKLKASQNEYENAERLIEQLRNELSAMAEKMETVQTNADEQLQKLNVIVQDHEHCQELHENLKIARDEVEKLAADKQAVDEVVKNLQDGQGRADITISKMREELTFIKGESEIERRNAESQIEKLKQIVIEHEKCQEVEKDLKNARDELEKLVADKQAVDEAVKNLQGAQERADITISKMREELTLIKGESEIERRKAESQIEKLKQIVIEHEKCQEVIENLKTARDQVEQLMAEKTAFQMEVKVQQNWNDEAEEKFHREVMGLMNRVQVAEEQAVHKNTVIATISKELESVKAQHKTREDLLESQLNELQSTNDKLSLSFEDLERELKNQRETCAKQTRYIEDQLALITSMNKLAEEHEHCRDLGGRLKYAEEQVANLTKSKGILQQQHLESQQGTFARIKVAEDQVGKLMTNNVALQHQLKAYQDMTAKLNSVQDQVEMLMVEKVALEQELKKHQDASEKAARGVVITRATQCSDLSTEIDHYRDASKHYRARAHNAEFELERTKKALEEIESEYHVVMRQGTSQEPATNRVQLKVNDGEAVTMVNRGLQCTLLNELLQRPKGNEGETRLVGLPGVSQLQSDLKSAEAARDKLKYELSKCNCGRKQFCSRGSEKPSDTVTTKYNVPTGFQRKVAFFQGGSTLMNRKESAAQPSRPQIMPNPTIEDKQEPKSTPASSNDRENIENTPEKVTSARSESPVEDQPEDDGYNWLLQLVQKKT